MCADTAAHSIPYYASSLVGRESDTHLLESLILDPAVQLITVTGTAGVGKTRLTAYVARKMQHIGRDGVLFVSLATITDPDLVPTEIGKALELLGDNLIDAIRSRFGAWQGIVLLDNLEQVVECAPAISRMLPHNPGLTVILTSQRPLQIDGERVVRLNSLPLPGENAAADELRSAPSVQLLVDRATQQDASFANALDDDATTAAIGEICRRLDGIPLALELAASRLATLSPEVVLAQLEQGQHILSSQRRDLPERQRTMHAAISWSFQLLPKDSQQAFLWLGTFTAGFDLAIVDELIAVRGLSTSAVDTISELMNLCLLQRVSGGANPWYTMLESMREFCLTELDLAGDLEAAREFVAAHVVRLANHTEQAFTSNESASWKAVLDRELPTVRSAVAWALANEEPYVPMVVATGMWRYLEQEGRWQEVTSWIEQAATWRDKLPEDVLIGGLITKMTMQEDGRDIPAALATAAEVKALLEGKDLPHHEVKYLLRSGSLAQDQQMLDDANAYFQQAVELADTHHFARDSAVARANIAIIAYFRGDYATAESNFLKVKATLAELGDKPGVANILSNLAATANVQNDPERALMYLDEANDIVRALGLKRDLIYSLLNQCSALLALGEIDAAANAAEEAIARAQELNYPSLQATGFVNMADIHLIREDYAAAATMALRALDTVSPEEGTRHYVEIGVILAEALSKSSRFADAEAVLAKSIAYAEEHQFTFDSLHLARIERVTSTSEAQLNDIDAVRERGRSWTDEVFVRNLGWFARRIAAISPGLLITIPEAPGLPDLTPREREILRLLTEGHSTRSLAAHLSVSPRTVTTHIANMMAKLEVSSRTELVAKAMRAQS